MTASATAEKATEKPTLMLLDGNSLAFRAFYALPAENFKTQGGLTTNAVYGFTAMLINLLRDEQPTHIAAAFDVSRQTFRLEKYPEYKAGRSATPDEFRGQIDITKEVLGALGITVLAEAGLRGRRRDRHAGHPGRGRGLPGAGGHRRPRLAATGQRRRHGALPAQGCQRADPVHPGGGRREVRADPAAVPGLRGAARRPERQPARHSRRGGEDRDQVDRRVRLAAGARRPGRHGQGQGRRRVARQPVARRAQPRADRSGQGRAAGADPRHAADAAVGPRPDPPAVRRPRVPGAARPAVRHAGVGGPRGRPGLRRARRRARGRRAGRPGWPSTATGSRFGLAVVGTHLAFDADATALAIVAADGDGRYIDTADLHRRRRGRAGVVAGRPRPAEGAARGEAGHARPGGPRLDAARRHVRHRAGRLSGAARSAQLRPRRPVAALPEARTARG